MLNLCKTVEIYDTWVLIISLLCPIPQLTVLEAIHWADVKKPGVSFLLGPWWGISLSHQESQEPIIYHITTPSKFQVARATFYWTL